MAITADGAEDTENAEEEGFPNEAVRIPIAVYPRQAMERPGNTQKTRKEGFERVRPLTRWSWLNLKNPDWVFLKTQRRKGAQSAE